MKRVILSLVIPAFAYGLTKDQFTTETRKRFEDKYVRVNAMLKRENIAQNNGLGKIFKELNGVTFDDAWQDFEIKREAGIFYDAVKSDALYEQFIENLKTADESEKQKILYEYIKFLQFKAKDILIKSCVGMEFQQEKSKGPHDMEWMKVDYPEWAQLNRDKNFDEKCKKSLVGINIGMSLFVQEVSEFIPKD